MDADIHRLNDRFCLPRALSFHPGPEGMTTAVLNNRFGTAEITLAGASIMSYRPHGGRETLWTSPTAAYELSNAMRGGIPICWPWFADHPEEPERYNMHGFARGMLFAVRSTQALADGSTELILAIQDTPETRAIWPYAFEFLVTIRLGPSLSVLCTAKNTGRESFTYTGALHPYFAVSNVHDLTLRGLEGTEFLDKYADFSRKAQTGPVTFPSWIDAVFLNTTTDMTLDDPGFRRTLHLRKTGSRTSVVWNPERDDATMPDVGAGQHPFFVCVESANAANDVVSVKPGEEAQLGMEIEVHPWREL